MINPKSERKQYWSFVKMDTATYQCTELQMLADASRDACLLFYMFVQRFANTEGCLAFQDGSVLVGMNEKQICAEGRRMGFKELETLNALNLMKSQTIHLLYQRRDGLWAITGLVDDPDAPILHIPERYEKLDEEGRYFPFSVGANRTKSQLLLNSNAKPALIGMDDYDHDQYASLDELTEMCGKNSKNSILQTLRRKGLIGFTEKKWKKRVVARWLLSMLIECIEGEITVEDFAFWYEQSLSCDTIVEKGDDYAEYLMSCDTENERNPHMTSHDSRMTSRDII